MKRNHQQLPFETKDLPLKLALKDVDKKTGTVTGYASAFGNKDLDGDVMMPGAFTRTLVERGPLGANVIKHLRQHRPEWPLGKPSVLKEDSFGLYFESTISKTTWGNDMLVLYEDGVIDQHSVGFRTVTDKFDEERNERQILEVKLYEFSTVAFGANELTPYLGMKSATGEPDLAGMFERMNALQRALRKELSQETAENLEIEMLQIQRAIIDLKGTTGNPAHQGASYRPGHEVMEALREQTSRMDHFINTAKG